MNSKTCLGIFLASLLVVGCKQAQVNGPLGGAMVTVTELRSGELVFDNAFTATADNVQEEFPQFWDSWGPVQKFLFVGNYTFTGNPTFAADTWYVLKMEGGSDFYADGDPGKEPNPVPVSGAVHALATGQQLNDVTFLVTPITEAAYQYVKDFVDVLDNNELAATLDQIAPQLVGDIDGDQQVNYYDVLVWNGGLNMPQLVANGAALAALSAAITGGQNDQVDALGDALFSEGAPDGVPEKIYADSISALIDAPTNQGGCGPGCHYPGGSGSLASSNDLVPTTTTDYVTLNTDNFRMLVETKGAGHVLNKIKGIGHGGGVRYPQGSSEYAALEAWLNLF